jgi:hypothetical protein
LECVERCDIIVPGYLLALLEDPEEELAEDRSAECCRANTPRGPDWAERNDYQALEAAIEDLARLDRYEQRAWLRQKRVILQLANIRLDRQFSKSSSA